MNRILSFRFALVPVLLLLLAAAGCSGPEARFSTDRQEYSGGDTVHLKNLSLAADSFQWSLNNQIIGHSESLDVVLAEDAAGPQVFTLKAIGSGRESVSSQTVQAVTPLGTVSVWSTFPGMEIVKVTDKGEQVAGVTSAGFEYEPACEAPGCLLLRLAPGTYTIDGKSMITRTRRVVEVQAGDCIPLKMH